MALTRKLLKGMGLSDELVDSIIEAHAETVDGLKADISKYKSDSEKLAGVQAELDEIKNKADDGYKEKYENINSEYAKYKEQIEAEKTLSSKQAAVKAYFESKGITGKNLEIAMRGSNAEISALELTDGAIADTSSLDDLIGGTYAGLVAETTINSVQTAKPPTVAETNYATMSDAEYYNQYYSKK